MSSSSPNLLSGHSDRHAVVIDPNREFHTRMQYDFYPGRFIEDFDPRFSENPDAIKGAVTGVVWLPRANTLFARAAIGPVDLHPQLGVLAEKDITKIELPKGLSHQHTGVFTSFSLADNTGQSINAIEHLREGATEADRQATVAIVNALGRRLMAATIDGAERYLAGEFDSRFPAARIESQGAIQLPDDNIEIKNFYDKPLN